MAIVEHNGASKRIPGLHFHKRKGAHEYAMLFFPDRGEYYFTIVGACVSVDTKGDPRNERFYYCSPVSQPVFLDASYSRLGISDRFRPVSWAKLPDGWKDAFRDYLIHVECWPF